MDRFNALAACCFAVAPVMIAACGVGDEVHLIASNASENPLYVRESALWPNPEAIPVCWEDAGFEQEKGWAREAVELSWELFSNVDFVGWRPCPSGSTEGIRIHWTSDKDLLGVALGLGTAIDGAVHGIRLNTWTNVHCVADQSFTREDCVRSSAVHELGHALGFAHEQNRADKPASCRKKPGGSNGSLAVGSFDSESAISYCATLRNGAGYLSETDIAGLQMFYGTRKEVAFGYDQGYRSARHPRMLADVNGDGLSDAVGFASDGVYISRSAGGRYAPPEDAFMAPMRVVSAFGYDSGGWRTAKHPRSMADVNGDKRADIVGFADDGVYVSLANSKGTSFSAPRRWIEAYGYEAGGWRIDRHPRLMADVNGDKRADVVGFADDGVYVSLANGAGTAFVEPKRWVAQFGRDQGWTVASHLRLAVDVNDDRRADIVGFGNGGVYVSLAKASGVGFEDRALWVANYAVNADAGGWSLPDNPRFLARVNDDALPDIVGFGNNHVYVSINGGSSFAAPAVWARDRFGKAAAAGGWRADRHVRAVADVDGDRLADIVGFYDKNVIVARAKASGFASSQPWSTGYDIADGWDAVENPRFVASVDGAAGGDLVGFGVDGLHATSLAVHIVSPQAP